MLLLFFIQTKDFKKDKVAQVNPPKYEKCEDMSNLTYLNDASVLYNLKQRYYHKLIYVSQEVFVLKECCTPCCTSFFFFNPYQLITPLTWHVTQAGSGTATQASLAVYAMNFALTLNLIFNCQLMLI